MRLNIKKGTIHTGLLYIVIFFLIVGTDSVWVRVNFQQNYHILTYIASIAVVYVLSYYAVHSHKRDSKNNYKLIKYVSIMGISIVLSQLVNMDTNSFGMYKFTILFLGAVICIKVDFKKFAKVYGKIMTFIALFSVIALIFQNRLIALPSVPILQYGEIGFKSLFLMNIYTVTVGGLQMRNPGPYWEPGAFQAFLNLALMFYLFVLNSQKGRKYYLTLLSLMVAIATTLSTTGIIVMLILLCAKIFDATNKGRKDKIFICIILLAICVLVIQNQTIYLRLFQKFNYQSSSSISYTTRLNSILLNFKLILKNPLLGLGINKFSTQYASASYLTANMDTEVNVVTSLSAWGLFGFGYFLVFNGLYIKMGSSLSRKVITKVLLIIAFVLMLNTEEWTYSLFWSILPLFAANKTVSEMDKIN